MPLTPPSERSARWTRFDPNLRPGTYPVTQKMILVGYDDVKGETYWAAAAEPFIRVMTLPFIDWVAGGKPLRLDMTFRLDNA